MTGMSLRQHLRLFSNEVVQQVRALSGTGGLFETVAIRRGRASAEGADIERGFWVCPAWRVDSDLSPHLVLRSSFHTIDEALLAAPLEVHDPNEVVSHPEVFDGLRAEAELERICVERLVDVSPAPSVEACGAPYEALWEFGVVTPAIEEDLGRRAHLRVRPATETEDEDKAWLNDLLLMGGAATWEAGARVALHDRDLLMANEYAMRAMDAAPAWGRAWAAGAAVAAAMGEAATVRDRARIAMATRGARDVAHELRALLASLPVEQDP
jgi:hypothetical protein